MNTSHCETCRYWNQMPAKVFQPTYNQKPVGEAIITEYGICIKVVPDWNEPSKNDGIATNEIYGEKADMLMTGPRFGCVHYDD